MPEEWWDIPGQEKTFVSAKKRHDLFGKLDALRFTEEVEDLDAEGFKTSIKGILRKTSTVLQLLQEEVYSNLNQI